jgi:uncharacterized protein (DUF1684 family)
MKRILVTGSRDWPDRAVVQDVLIQYVQDNSKWDEWPDWRVFKKFTLVHGDAPGLDRIAAHIAKTLGMQVEAHPAHWLKYGKAAGPKRNQAMVALGADVCLAFIKDNSKGATGCARMARNANIETRYYRIDTT